VGCYRFETKVGWFYLVPRDGGWDACFGEERIGWYGNARLAADDLAGGHTFTPSCGDTSELGISENLGDWEWVDRR
jgi:hypothetical protein